MDEEVQMSTVVPVPQNMLLTKTALLKARKPPWLRVVLYRNNGIRMVPLRKQE